VAKFVKEVGFKSGVKREEVMAGENVNRQRKTRARNRGICTRLSERNRELSLCTQGGSVAEWLACRTRAQWGLGSNRSRDDVG